jgi:hypothetical protein
MEIIDWAKNSIKLPQMHEFALPIKLAISPLKKLPSTEPRITIADMMS